MSNCELRVNFQLHHVGVAVGSIDRAAAQLAGHFGYVQVTPVYEDPVQAAFVQFWLSNGLQH
jgi:hypothetical protein